MTDWQEAEVGKQPELAPTLSTDELVLWLGEAVINEKQQRRIAAFQQQKIQVLENEALKDKSVSMGINTKIEELVVEIANLKLTLEAVRNEQHPRIVQLEEQVHAIALERDALVKELQIHTATIKQKKKGK